MRKKDRILFLVSFVVLIFSCDTDSKDNTIYHQYKKEGDYIVFFSEASDKEMQVNFDTNLYDTGINLGETGSVKVMVKCLSDNQGEFGLRIGNKDIYNGLYIYNNGNSVRIIGFVGKGLLGSIITIGASVPTPIAIGNGSENELRIDYDFPNKVFSYFINGEMAYYPENFPELDFTNIGRTLYFTVSYNFNSLPTKEEPYKTGFKVISPKIFP